MNEQQNAFEKLKQYLTSTEVIAYYNQDAETHLVVDGSKYGVGAILNQKQPNGDIRPVAYASRTLTPVERRYTQSEQGALAVLFGNTKIPFSPLHIKQHQELRTWY